MSSRFMNNPIPRVRRGFTLVEVMVVVMIILILACIAVPGLRRYRRMGLAQRCVANLRIIQHARESYFYDNPTSTAIPSADALNPYLPLNVASGEKFTAITCVGSTYLYQAPVTDLSILPTCPNWVSTTFSTDLAQEYGEHLIRTETN